MALFPIGFWVPTRFWCTQMPLPSLSFPFLFFLSPYSTISFCFVYSVLVNHCHMQSYLQGVSLCPGCTYFSATLELQAKLNFKKRSLSGSSHFLMNSVQISLKLMAEPSQYAWNNEPKPSQAHLQKYPAWLTWDQAGQACATLHLPLAGDTMWENLSSVEYRQPVKGELNVAILIDIDFVMINFNWVKDLVLLWGTLKGLGRKINKSEKTRTHQNRTPTSPC